MKLSQKAKWHWHTLQQSLPSVSVAQHICHIIGPLTHPNGQQQLLAFFLKKLSYTLENWHGTKKWRFGSDVFPLQLGGV